MRVETPDIYEDLKRKLITAAFLPGVRLKPAELQGEYGCSANTVRDVLMRLANVGLVEFEMQRGFRVKPVSIAICNDITRFRVLLEQEGTTRSMRTGGVAWEAKLTAAHHALRHIESQIAGEGDVKPYKELWAEAERSFHETLISGCGSPILRESYGAVYLQFRQQMVSLETEFNKSYFHTIIGEHQAILDAAIGRDEEACRSAIYNHMKRNIRAV